ncbi:MAG: WbqC family protein [Methylobacter sp.]|nr:WbqC family protein [Methylobacter sp.]
MSVVVVLQPGYLPWLGFFDQLIRSDVFVYYDDVQYDKHGWRNRNRIKSPTGPIWLTVPVLNGGRFGQKIHEVEIDNRSSWARKHITAIGQNYSKAPYVRRFLPQLEELLMRRWDSLAELDIASVEMICDWIGIHRKVERSSKLGIEGEQSGRLLDICRHFKADRYLSGDSAQNYLDIEAFAQQGVQVEWQSYQHPVYRQLHGEFIPYLSIIDLVMNLGEKSLSVLNGKPL